MDKIELECKTAKVHVQGGSYLVTIPKLIADAFHFKRGDTFTMKLSGTELIMDLNQKGGNNTGGGVRCN